MTRASAAAATVPTFVTEPRFVNYVAETLASLAAGRPIATAQTEPYGSTVNYSR